MPHKRIVPSSEPDAISLPSGEMSRQSIRRSESPPRILSGFPLPTSHRIISEPTPSGPPDTEARIRPSGVKAIDVDGGTQLYIDCTFKVFKSFALATSHNLTRLVVDDAKILPSGEKTTVDKPPSKVRTSFPLATS